MWQWHVAPMYNTRASTSLSSPWFYHGDGCGFRSLYLSAARTGCSCCDRMLSELRAPLGTLWLTFSAHEEGTLISAVFKHKASCLPGPMSETGLPLTAYTGRFVSSGRQLFSTSLMLLIITLENFAKCRKLFGYNRFTCVWIWPEKSELRLNVFLIGGFVHMR